MRESREDMLAIRTQQEVADILFDRGVLKSPSRTTVDWYERNAFKKIRKLFPELAQEIDSGETED